MSAMVMYSYEALFKVIFFLNAFICHQIKQRNIKKSDLLLPYL